MLKIGSIKDCIEFLISLLIIDKLQIFFKVSLFLDVKLSEFIISLIQMRDNLQIYIIIFDNWCLMPKKYRSKAQPTQENSFNSFHSGLDNEISQTTIELPFKAKEVFILWLANFIPPGQKNYHVTLQFDEEQQKLNLKGQKEKIQVYVTTLRQYIASYAFKKIQFESKVHNLDKIEYNINRFDARYGCMVFRRKIIQLAGKEMIHKYMIKQVKELIQKIVEEKEGYEFIMVSIRKENVDQIMEKIHDILKEEQNESLKQINKQEITRNVKKEQDQRTIKKKKFKEVSKPIKRQSEDQLQNVQQNYYKQTYGDSNIKKQSAPTGINQYRNSQKDQRNSQNNKIIIFEGQYPSQYLQVEHFKNWVKRSKNLEAEDIQIEQNEQTVKVKLYSKNKNADKLNGIKYYFEFQKIFWIEDFIQDKILQEIPNIEKKHKNVKIKHQKGFMAKNTNEAKLRFLIREGNIGKNNINKEKFNILLITGIITQVATIQQQIQQLLEKMPKEDKTEEIFTELKDLKQYVRDKRVQEIIKKEVEKYIKDEFSNEISSYSLTFSLREVYIQVKVKFDKIDVFSNGIKEKISLCIPNLIKIHKFGQINPEKFNNQTFDHFESRYCLIRRLGEAIMIIEQQRYIEAINDILSNVKVKNKVLNQTITLDKNKRHLVQKIEKQIKVEFDQFKEIKIVYAQNKINDTIDIWGDETAVRDFKREIQTRLEQATKNIIQEAYHISDQQAQVLEKNKKIIEDANKDYNIGIVIRKKVQLGAKITVGKNIQILIIKEQRNSIQLFKKLQSGSFVFFRSIQQINKVKDNILSTLKMQIKVSNNESMTKDERSNIEYIYINNASIDDMITKTVKKNIQDIVSLALFMPSKMKKQFVQQLIEYITQKYEKLNFKIKIFQNDLQEDLEKTLEFKMPDQKKIQKWYTDVNGQRIFFSEIGINKINQSIKKGKNILYLTNEDLNLTVPTHLCQINQKTITHLQSGRSLQIKVKGGSMSFQMNQMQFEFPQSQMLKIKEAMKNQKNQCQISLGVYLIDIADRKQINLFSQFKRKIFSSEEEVKGGFKQKIDAIYGIKTNEMVFQYQSAHAKVLQKAYNYVMEELKKREITKNLKLKSYNQTTNKDIQQYAEQNNVKVQIKDGYMLVRGFQEKDINRFLALYATIEKAREVEYPKEWEQQTEEIQAIEVSPKSQQFKNIQNKFNCATIIKLQRLQNPILYKKFYEENCFLNQHNQGKAVKKIMLFHGSRKTNPSDIWEDKQESFNINYTSNNNYLGKGIYFAQNPQYSVSYSYSVDNQAQKQQFSLIGLRSKPRKQMFYCEVCVGESQDKKPDMKDTDFKDAAKKIRYESATSNYDGSQIYVIYKSRRAYPKYLITY